MCWMCQKPVSGDHDVCHEKFHEFKTHETFDNTDIRPTLQYELSYNPHHISRPVLNQVCIFYEILVTLAHLS